MSVLCLQGGGEFGARCRGMDEQLLLRCGSGPVVIAGLAARPGLEYETACANGAGYFARLGAREVRTAPDARTDLPGALAALGAAGLIFLPGGSPRLLLDSLSGPVGELVAERAGAGVPVVGASAGAMVLCEWTALPEGPGAVEVVPGLGLVPGVLVLPHYTPAGPSWPAPAGVRLLGIPEASGVIVEGTSFGWLGDRASRFLDGTELPQAR
ncbi:MAG: Type 1 glutamine amidotransferase-like domain-containing protein [Mycobacteriales bacterium]